MRVIRNERAVNVDIVPVKCMFELAGVDTIFLSHVL